MVLRQAHYSMGQIGALGWLQLPWQLKIFWSHIADGPAGRRHGRLLLLGLQLVLTLLVGLFALSPFAQAPIRWLVLTAACALVAATQDVFVDALAVRTLGPAERGLGNTAQVGAYRVGMMAGGAGLLVFAGAVGERGAILVCAGLVLLASVGAFVLREDEVGHAPDAQEAAAAREAARAERLLLVGMLRHLVGRGAWPVLALALTYKLGLHMASVLIKPMAVDAHWTTRQIGLAVTTAGTASAILGALAGGLLHGALRERRALVVGALLQSLVCVPLLVADRLGAPIGWTTAAIAVEHFVTGLGTTLLFAGLMSATRPADAGRHYTILTSANVLCGGIGATAGGFLADHLGRAPVFALAGLACLLPLALLPSWERAAAASASSGHALDAPRA